jgi:hypothetical protein
VQEDQATNAALRKEIEKAWAMVDVAQEKEVGQALRLNKGQLGLFR